MSLNSNKNYAIKPQAEGFVYKPSGINQSALKSIKRSRKGVIGFSAFVWVACGAYAYHTWKNKKEDMSEDIDEKIPEIDPNVPKTMKEAITPKIYKGWIERTPEEYAKHYISSNPNVVLNKEKERVEIYKIYRYKWPSITLTTAVPLDIIAKDEDGNLLFDEDGYPIRIIKRGKILQFLHDDFLQFCGFFKIK